jgi:hypothetical protein
VSGVGLVTHGWVDLVVAGGGGGAGPVSVDGFSPDPELEPGEPGAFSADWATAKQTPITFTVTNGVFFFIFIRYVNDSKTYGVYNGAIFVSPFDSTSDIADGDPGETIFTIIPAGGWPASIECLNIVIVDEDGGITGLDGGGGEGG